jgi:hypothetical protein
LVQKIGQVATGRAREAVIQLFETCAIDFGFTLGSVALLPLPYGLMGGWLINSLL